MSEIRSFVLMLQFFTRLPLNWSIPFEEGMLAKSISWLPMVGMVVGILNAVVYALGNFLAGPHIGVLAAIGMNLFVTGGFHLDGLADTCDGIYSSRNRDRMLEIMKDSRIGTNGTCALILAFLVRYSGLLSLPERSIPYVILFMPVVARSCNALLMRSKYARKEGLGNLFIGKVSGRRATFSVCMGGALIFFFTENVWFLASYGLTAAAQLVFCHYITAILGGMTGDTLGAGDELSELFWLLLCCIGVFQGIYL